MNFQLLASPWWVNLFILVPIFLWFWWRGGLKLGKRELLGTGIFGLVFGMTEAIVVIYLRTIGNSEVQIQALATLPPRIVEIEMLRELCTIVMLGAVAFLGAKTNKERWALFFYAFSIWDIVYYLGLKILIGWPESLLTQDVLFLMPVPWVSQVWFPILVCLLIILVVLMKSDSKLMGKSQR